MLIQRSIEIVRYAVPETPLWNSFLSLPPTAETKVAFRLLSSGLTLEKVIEKLELPRRVLQQLQTFSEIQRENVEAQVQQSTFNCLKTLLPPSENGGSLDSQVFRHQTYL